VLGYVTAEEMGLPPEPPRVFTPTVEEAIAILEDPKVPAAQKEEWLRYLRYVSRRDEDGQGPAVSCTAPQGDSGSTRLRVFR
jgi:hypothetical protein